MTIPREFIELLLSKIDIVDLIHTYLPLQKKSNHNFFARCPFHNEKSASFSVSQPKQFYYCFGCGAHGNAIDFLMQHHHLSFPEAIEMLAQEASMEVPHHATQPDKTTRDRAPLYQLMNEVAHYYYEEMRHSERAIAYLKQRGISGVMAQTFQLGFAPPGWTHVLDQFKTRKEELLATGLIIKKEDQTYYDRFRERIMFPIHDIRGRVIGFGGRILAEGEPKYLNSPETVLFQKGQELYGIHQALQLNRQLTKVIVVEGYMDVIALFQCGISYAVATLGTATTPQHLKKLFRYTSEIIFCFDGDAAGKKAAWRALEVIFPLMQDKLQIRFLFLPDGEDPDSLIRKNGAPHFISLMNNALSLSAFFLQTLSKQCDMATLEGRARFATLAINHLKQLPSGSIFQAMLLEELAKQARIEEMQLKKQISSRGQIKQNSAPPSHSMDKDLPAAMRIVLALLVQNPQLISLISEPPQQVPGEALLNQLIEIIKKNPDITTGRLLEYWRDQKEINLLAHLIKQETLIPEEGLKKEMRGALRQLKLLEIEQEINKLLTKGAISSLNEADKKALANWINKKKDLTMNLTD